MYERYFVQFSLQQFDLQDFPQASVSERDLRNSLWIKTVSLQEGDALSLEPDSVQGRPFSFVPWLEKRK